MGDLFKKIGFWLITVSICLLEGCSIDGDTVPDISNVPPVDVSIRRLEQEVMSLKNKDGIQAFLKENPYLTDKYFRRKQYPNDSLLVDAIYSFTSDKHTDTLLNDVSEIFADISQLERDLETAFQFARYYFPDFVVPEVYTSISGFNAFGFGNDIFLTDSIVVIGLDWYAGHQSSYRPPDIPNYMLSRYKPDFIVPNVITYMSAKYNNYNYQDPTLLADMIYYGKAYHFTKSLLPNVSDTLIIGYTTEELELSNKYQHVIWGSFVENNLFYEKVENEKNKYIGERPTVVEIADKCPGRIGRWLGWEIVRAYAKKNGSISLHELMKISDAKGLFLQSGFKPNLP